MTGGSEAEDNPVGMNVVPTVDIISCLCVFCMCSFEFKELEGRFQAWLPKDLGNMAESIEPPREMRIAMDWDEVRQSTVRRFGLRTAQSDDELAALIDGAHADHLQIGQPDIPLIVDADARVPWNEVMRVVNISRRARIARIEFARGAPPPSVGDESVSRQRDRVRLVRTQVLLARSIAKVAAAQHRTQSSPPGAGRKFLRRFLGDPSATCADLSGGTRFLREPLRPSPRRRGTSAGGPIGFR